jgi:signal transduction histidine kinase
MSFRSIRWQLAVSYAAIALVAALVLGVVLLSILRSYYAEREQANVMANATAIERFLVDNGALTSPTLKAQMQAFAFLTQARVRVFDAAGHLLVDTGPAASQVVAVSGLDPASASAITALPAPISGKANLPGSHALIVLRAAGNDLFTYQSVGAAAKPGATLPLSNVIQTKTFALTAPNEITPDGPRSQQVARVAVQDLNGQMLGRVELSEAPALGSQILTSVARGWALAGLAAVILATVVGWFASRRLSAPLLALSAVTGRMAAGDLTARAAMGRRDELGLLAGSFNEMAAQIETTILALRHFVSDAAHEIHTPLTALRTNLEVAAGEPDPAQQVVLLERAQAQVTRLQHLTDSLLELSRVEAGAGQEAAAPLDLAALVRQMVELLASSADAAGLDFSLELPGGPVMVLGRECQLQGVVNSLVDNAIKFTPPGGSVTVALQQDDGYARLRVCDTGIGIPADDLPQLFNRFHRGRNTAAYPGNGLGLAIVRAVVAGHGGRVSAANGEQGAVFTVELPTDAA